MDRCDCKPRPKFRLRKRTKPPAMPSDGIIWDSLLWVLKTPSDKDGPGQLRRNHRELLDVFSGVPQTAGRQDELFFWFEFEVFRNTTIRNHACVLDRSIMSIQRAQHCRT